MSALVTTEKPTRPVLRYHGGKWRLAEWILSYFAPHRTYVEPFGGAASVLIQKPRSYSEVYNDLDGEVCNLFRVLRDPAQARELKRVVELTPFARAEFEMSYASAQDPIEQARRTLIRSGMGFGSAASSGQMVGFRSSVTRSYTTPAIDWSNYPAQIESFIARLRGVIIENRAACEVLKRYDGPETLSYIDPPYPHSTRSQKQRNSFAYRFEMTDGEHRELAEVAHALRGMAILSGYACDLYDRELYADWQRVERETFADGARARTEVLWLNNAASAALESNRTQQTFF